MQHQPAWTHGLSQPTLLPVSRGLGRRTRPRRRRTARGTRLGGPRRSGRARAARPVQPPHVLPHTARHRARMGTGRHARPRHRYVGRARPAGLGRPVAVDHRSEQRPRPHGGRRPRRRPGHRVRGGRALSNPAQLRHAGPSPSAKAATAPAWSGTPTAAHAPGRPRSSRSIGPSRPRSSATHTFASTGPHTPYAPRSCSGPCRRRSAARSPSRTPSS